jgi:hypothetical protein
MPLDSGTMPATVIRDKKLIAAVHLYAANKAAAKALEAENDALKDKIIDAMGSASVASAGAHVIRLTDIPDTLGTPNRIITKAMIGQVIIGSKGRAGSTRLEVI